MSTTAATQASPVHHLGGHRRDVHRPGAVRRGPSSSACTSRPRPPTTCSRGSRRPSARPPRPRALAVARAARRHLGLRLLDDPLHQRHPAGQGRPHRVHHHAGPPRRPAYKEGGKDQLAQLGHAVPKPYVPAPAHLRAHRAGAGRRRGRDAARRGRGPRGDRRASRELEVEAVGVCLLWAPLNPEHELRVGELLAEMLPASRSRSATRSTASSASTGGLRDRHRRVAQAADAPPPDRHRRAAARAELPGRAADGHPCLGRRPAPRPDRRAAAADGRLRARRWRRSPGCFYGQAEPAPTATTSSSSTPAARRSTPA